MVDAERIKELERLDRRFIMKKRLTTAAFVIISVALIIYAVRIEMKIDQLTEDPAVVVYTDASDEEVSGSNNSTDNSGDNTVTDESAVSYNEPIVDNTKVYYVTSSGTKYHSDGCSYLTKSKREITFAEIMGGGYTPCSRCIKE